MLGRFAGRFRKPAGYGARIGAATPLLVALLASLGAMLAVGNLAFLKNFDNFLSDSEIGPFTPSEPQDSNIVIAAITEDTLKTFPYRSPIDRQFLSGLLSTLEERGARAIVVDILFDQATEPEKDALLAQTLAGMTVPVFVGYTEAAGVVTEAQQGFLDAFVPLQNRSMVTIFGDQFGTVRWISPGQEAHDGRFVPSFSHSSAAVMNIHAPNELIPIVWHGQPDPETRAFAQYLAHLAGILPAEWFKDKIVLIFIDVRLTDRHRTPVTNVSNIAEGMAGIAIHAYSLATLLDRRGSAVAGFGTNLLLAFVLGLCGAGLGLANWPFLLRATLSIGLILIFGPAGSHCLMLEARWSACFRRCWHLAPHSGPWKR